MNNLDSRSPHWLTDDEPLPPEVRDALRLADQEDGQAAQIARLEARLAPLFLSPDASSAVGHSTAAAATGRSIWSAGTMLGAGAALLGIAALVWPQREHALRGMPSLVATYQNEAELPLRPLKGLEFAASEMNLPAKDSSATPAVPHPARETPTLTESPSKLAQRARTSVKGAPPAIAENTLALEARLLGRARKALPLAPDEALLLTERHRARFPDGVLVEEREAIAIRAMHQAGMLEGARARHVQFLARFPASPHARNLDALANASRVSR